MKKKSLSIGIWRRAALPALALMVLWLVMSGIYDAFHVGLGIASVILVLAMNFRFTFATGESRETRHSPRWNRVVLYLLWLVKEMVLSGLEVARVVITPKMPLDPCLIRFKSDQPNDVARVILGNSITLTPGTLTVDMEDQEYLIHALTRSTAEDLLNEAMQTRVARLFVDNPQHMVFDTKFVTTRTGRTV